MVIRKQPMAADSWKNAFLKARQSPWKILAAQFIFSTISG